MNNREKNVMSEVKVMCARIETNIKWIRKNVDEHNGKLDEINKKIVKVETNLENHLKHHELSLTKMSIMVGIMTFLISMAIKLWLG